MKSILCASCFLLVLVSLTLTPLTFAGANGPSANGSFQFALEDDQPRFLEFNAREQNKGNVVGEMSFTDPNASVVIDPDAIGCQSFSLSSYSFTDIAHGGGNVQVKP
ncbi:MAG TPA: hypothetical protein VN844_30285 [Pyrinomonadaceae bacterium]|nr:hypothetical protein [Pyrinomonadaceae bacterium]